MEEVIDSHNEQFQIDEDREDGSITVNGHNNRIIISTSYVNSIIIMGHNNSIQGSNSELIGQMQVMGHNNTIRNLQI